MPGSRPARSGHGPSEGVPERRAARVVLVDPAPAVLLLSGRDPSDPAALPFWFVPGGGAEVGEPTEDAARRELYEETGTTLGDLGPVVWARRADFVFDGRTYRQAEVFYVVRTEPFSVRATALTEDEHRFIKSWRWWPLAELASTDEVVYPVDLARLVARWLAEGPAPGPARIR
ncbi:MAG: NUDIX hydrolase [Acidimicrobiales bacterium]